MMAEGDVLPSSSSSVARLRVSLEYMARLKLFLFSSVVFSCGKDKAILHRSNIVQHMT